MVLSKDQILRYGSQRGMVSHDSAMAHMKHGFQGGKSRSKIIQKYSQIWQPIPHTGGVTRSAITSKQNQIHDFFILNFKIL